MRRRLPDRKPDTIWEHLVELAQRYPDEPITLELLKKDGCVSVQSIRRNLHLNLEQVNVRLGRRSARVNSPDLNHMLQQLADLIHRVGDREPTKREVREHTWYSAGRYVQAFGSLARAIDQALQLDSTSPPAQANTPTEAGTPTSRRTVSSRVYGDPLADSRVLQYSPVVEQELIALFVEACAAGRLLYRILSLRTEFPDAELLQPVRSGRNERVRAEFELNSSNFKQHGHQVSGCDLIICWANDWKECPLPVIEVRSFFRLSRELP